MNRPRIGPFVVACSLAIAPALAHAQTASVYLRARANDRASLVACPEDRVVSWSISSGEAAPREEWSAPSPCVQDSLRPLSDGSVVFVSARGAVSSLLRLSPRGDELFRVELSSRSWGAPLLVDQRIVVRLANGALEWRSLESGALEFYRRTDAASDPRDLLSAGDPALVQTRGGTRVCVARASGVECWSSFDGRSSEDFALREGARVTSRLLAVDVDRDGDDELVVATDGGGVRALGRDGRDRWARSGPTRALVLGAPIAFYQGRTLLIAWADVDRWVTVVEASSGALVQGFHRRIEGVARSSLRVADVDGDGVMDVLATERAGTLSALRVSDGASVSVSAPSIARAPVDGESLLAATGDGVVHWFAIDGSRSLAHHALATTALGIEDAVLVDQRDRRPALVESPREPEIATIASTQSRPVAAARATAGCSVSRSARRDDNPWGALVFAVAALIAARRASRERAPTPAKTQVQR